MFYYKNFQEYLSKSRAILIFPEVYEGGFIFGAKGGNGVLLIKKGDKFTGPFFYSLGGLSIGLQAGAKSGRVVMTVMTTYIFITTSTCSCSLWCSTTKKHATMGMHFIMPVKKDTFYICFASI